MEKRKLKYNSNVAKKSKVKKKSQILGNSIQFLGGEYVDRPVFTPNRHHAKAVRIASRDLQIYGYCFWRVWCTMNDERWALIANAVVAAAVEAVAQAQHHHQHRTMALWESDYKSCLESSDDWDTSRQAKQIKVSRFCFSEMQDLYTRWCSHINTQLYSRSCTPHTVHISQ